MMAFEAFDMVVAMKSGNGCTVAFEEIESSCTLSGAGNAVGDSAEVSVASRGYSALPMRSNKGTMGLSCSQRQEKLRGPLQSISSSARGMRTIIPKQCLKRVVVPDSLAMANPRELFRGCDWWASAMRRDSVVGGVRVRGCAQYTDRALGG